MSTKQGYIKDFEDNKMLPETTTVMVTDVARSQALSASMLALVEKNALGYPDFTTTDDWSAGDKCFHDRRLWNFTSDHAAGDWDANDVEEFSVKEYMDALANEMETVESEYLKKGTYSADTAVGLADNLRGQTVDSEAYLIRPTGGAENEVSNGVASVLGMEGNSAVWNQIVNYNTIQVFYSDGLSYSVSGTEIQISKTNDDANFISFTSVKIIPNHKYYYSADVKKQDGPDSARIGIGFVDASNANSGYASTTNTEYERVSNILTVSTETRFVVRPTNAYVGTAYAKNIICIDLTLLGIDNLTTTAQVEAWLAQHVGTKPYYAYNAGTILSAQTLGIKTYGQNLLNPTTRQAKLIPYTWVENGTTYSNQYTIKNVPSGATATFTPDNTGVAETVDISSGTLDITSYGSGILELSAATADTYVCMKWDEQKDDDVVPYEDHTYDFDVRKVYGKVNGEGSYMQCFPNGMKSAGSVHDTLAASEAVVKVGSVDLGTFDWHVYPTRPTTFISRVPIGSSSGTVNVITTKGYSPTNTQWDVLQDKQLRLYTNGDVIIAIKDTSYDSPSAFKTAMNGVMMHYPYIAANRITYTDLIYRDGGIDRHLADVLMNITVNNWSMEEQLLTPYDNGNPTAVPATIKTQYGMDAVEAIDTLQKTCYFADDVHANLQALLTCINTNCAETLGGTFSVSDTATDKVFKFTFTPTTEPDVEPTNEGE